MRATADEYLHARRPMTGFEQTLILASCILMIITIFVCSVGIGMLIAVHRDGTACSLW